MCRGLKATLARQAEAQEGRTSRAGGKAAREEPSVDAPSNASIIEMYSLYDQCSTR